MELNRLPSMSASDSESAVTEISESGFDADLGGQWKLVSIPASKIDSDTSSWFQEKPDSGIIIGKYGGDNYEAAVDASCLSKLEASQRHINLEYNPTQPEERQKAVYGTPTTTRKARDRWLLHAADVIYSTSSLEIVQAVCEHVRRYSLQGELARAILIRNISTAIDPGQRKLARKLAQKLVLFFLHLAPDHSCLQSDESELLESLQDALRPTVQAKRTERDEAQITTLFGALLEFPSVGVNLRQYELAEDYTVN